MPSRGDMTLRFSCSPNLPPPMIVVSIYHNDLFLSLPIYIYIHIFIYAVYHHHHHHHRHRHLLLHSKCILPIHWLHWNRSILKPHMRMDVLPTFVFRRRKSTTIVSPVHLLRTQNKAPFGGWRSYLFVCEYPSR